jgi:hypothetical protein
MKLDPKKRPSDRRLSSPPSPKAPCLISNTSPRRPSESSSGETRGLVRNRTTSSAQFGCTCTTRAPASPTARSRAASSATSPLENPTFRASALVRVSSSPAATTPGISMLSSTIASAIRGSSPRSSATARNSARMAETILGEPLWPSPSTGVAAPSTAPGRM